MKKNCNHIPGSSYLLCGSQLAGSDLASCERILRVLFVFFFGLIFISVLIVSEVENFWSFRTVKHRYNTLLVLVVSVHLSKIDKSLTWVRKPSLNSIEALLGWEIIFPEASGRLLSWRWKNGRDGGLLRLCLTHCKLLRWSVGWTQCIVIFLIKVNVGVESRSLGDSWYSLVECGSKVLFCVAQGHRDLPFLGGVWHSAVTAAGCP